MHVAAIRCPMRAQVQWLCTSDAAASLQAADMPSVEFTKINKLRTLIIHFPFIASFGSVHSASWNIFTEG
jgi:hypothetical protein